jgi:hypothetical protein
MQKKLRGSTIIPSNHFHTPRLHIEDAMVKLAVVVACSKYSVVH